MLRSFLVCNPIATCASHLPTMMICVPSLTSVSHVDMYPIAFYGCTPFLPLHASLLTCAHARQPEVAMWSQGTHMLARLHPPHCTVRHPQSSCTPLCTVLPLSSLNHLRYQLSTPDVLLLQLSNFESIATDSKFLKESAYDYSADEWDFDF